MPVPMPMVVDRLPPHSIESEQGVLGCILLEPKQCLSDALELLGGSEVFYDLRHQSLFDAFRAMSDKGLLIEPITLQSFLKDTNQLEALGGMPYIAGLMNAVPSAANLEHYIAIVRDKYSLRRVIQTCTAAVARVYDHQGEAREVMDQTGREIVEVCADGTFNKRHSIRELVHRAVNSIEERHLNQGKASGIPTGLTDFDKMTGGLHNSEMIVIAARPSQGKSTIGMNIVDHVAIELKIPCGVFSLEMTADALTLRMICTRARVNSRHIDDGFLSERDFPKLTGAAGKISAAPIFIDDSASINLMQLRARARRMYHQDGVRLFLIDYIQILRSGQRGLEARQDMTIVSNGLKELAKELNVPVIVLAQLNRDLEKGGKSGAPRKPRMSDIKECDAIAADADLIGMLYKPAQSEEDEEAQGTDSVPMNLFIAKQRNGPTGDVNLMFLKSITKFESISRVSEPEQTDY